MENMVTNLMSREFWNKKKVFVTGHTGFKGSWLILLLKYLGAEVYGYALKPPTDPSFYELAELDEIVNSTIGDIRDYSLLLKALKEAKPDIIIHMAAQALVRESYQNPRETYEINVMGTANLLDAVRQLENVKVILNVTTDKCYENKEWHWGYRENDRMGGYDPYSNSKACSELLTASFRSSFYNPKDYPSHGVALATARAGNVIGGGDWAADRLIPDFVRSIIRGEKVIIRSPFAIRSWQHVLEPLTGYLLLSEKLFTSGNSYAEAWNFGAEDRDAKNVEWIIGKICELWGDGASYAIDHSPQPHEATYLKLDCSKARIKLTWQPRWNIETTLRSIVNWTKAYLSHDDMRKFSIQQIENYYQ
jgi:CDP-glucose 4,6-dehydratase